MNHSACGLRLPRFRTTHRPDIAADWSVAFDVRPALGRSVGLKTCWRTLLPCGSDPQKGIAYRSPRYSREKNQRKLPRNLVQ